jgi:hypothetical protein
MFLLQKELDVLCMRQISFKEGQSKLRNDVSKLVLSWNNGTRMVDRASTKTSIDEQGPRRTIGQPK